MLIIIRIIIHHPSNPWLHPHCQVSDVANETLATVDQSLNWLQVEVTTQETVDLVLHNNFQDEDTTAYTTIIITPWTPGLWERNAKSR